MKWRSLWLGLGVLWSGCETSTDSIKLGDTPDPVVTSNDLDRDGYDAGVDCDDNDASVHPGVAEVCDGIDNDCDGIIDPDTSAGAPIWMVDADGDGFGDPTQTVTACAIADGLSADGSDCDDTNRDVHPDALETCNGFDDDCDGLIDDSDPSIDTASQSAWFVDADGDGWGDPGAPFLACSDDVPNASRDGSDCDDTLAAVHPTADEICDDLDNDCDGAVDGDDPSVDLSTARTFYFDQDGDGYGVLDLTQHDCSRPLGYARSAGDCDDLDDAINPSAAEVCDDVGVDEDCNGYVNDEDSTLDISTATLYFIDADEDGFGDIADSGTSACLDPSSATTSYVRTADDCDDTREDVHPFATEVCDPLDTDEDCDGLSDDNDPTVDATTMALWFEDADSDGFGSEDTGTIFACDNPSDPSTTYVADDGDCDDSNADINPDATEVCDATDVDEDCNGLVNDSDPDVDLSTGVSTYLDADSDGYGDASTELVVCDLPADRIYDGSDCDDTVAEVNPGATEVCSDYDDDCNPSTSQAGMVAFWAASGGVTDLTSVWSTSSSSVDAWTAPDDGDLWVCAGTYYMTLEVGGNAVNIIGPDGSPSTIIDANGLGSVLSVVANADVVASGLTLQNGGAADGAGIMIDTASFDGTDIVVQDNIASDDGGGIYVNKGVLTLDSCEISRNVGVDGGGVHVDGAASSATFSNCSWTSNIASSHGGGLYTNTATSSVSISTSAFVSNLAVSQGGGVRSEGVYLNIVSTTFDSNAANDGGGVRTKTNANFEDVSWSGNSAGNRGGGLFCDLADNEECNIVDSSFSTNSATSGDGAYIKVVDKPASLAKFSTVDFSGQTSGTTDIFFSGNSNSSVTSHSSSASYTCLFDDGCL